MSEAEDPQKTYAEMLRDAQRAITPKAKTDPFRKPSIYIGKQRTFGPSTRKAKAATARRNVDNGGTATPFG